MGLYLGAGGNDKNHSKQILSRVGSLLGLPAVVAQVLELTAQPEFPMKRLMQVVSLDPGFTTNVLAKANSAFFGLGAKVSTLSQAVTHLGVQNIVVLL